MKNKISTIAIITTYFLLMGTLGIIASVPNQVSKASKEHVRREIIRNISIPRMMSEGTDITEVKAVVNVDESGRVRVEDVQSSNQELKNYMLNQLQDISIKNVANSERIILIVRFIAS
ncbi:MAG: hypothetical protein IPP77_07600 [Bacteroidetes bacterium]|nr:hypothetical protein [Bacteroidota bacterium]